MQPTNKSDAIETALTNIFDVDRVGSIIAGVCAWCDAPADSFRDDLSRKEYRISGMCQNCQDDVFGGVHD